jgi:hypothetical protein
VSSRRGMRLLVLLLCASVMLERAAGQGASPARTVLAVCFLALAPGLGVVGLLRLSDPWLQAALVPALSLALDAIVGGVLSYAGLWSPTAGILILVAISALGALAGVGPSLRRRSAR